MENKLIIRSATNENTTGETTIERDSNDDSNEKKTVRDGPFKTNHAVRMKNGASARRLVVASAVRLWGGWPVGYPGVGVVPRSLLPPKRAYRTRRTPRTSSWTHGFFFSRLRRSTVFDSSGGEGGEGRALYAGGWAEGDDFSLTPVSLFEFPFWKTNMRVHAARFIRDFSIVLPVSGE